MKKITTLLLTIVLANAMQAQSPNWLWAKGMGGTDNDYCNSVAIDASGNVYTVGAFNGTVDFDPGAGVFNLTAVDLSDIFISKIDASGNFIWAKAMGGTGDDNGQFIAIDLKGSGAVYISGYFYNTVDFDPGAGVFNLTGNGKFISKLDSSGNFVWARAIIGFGSSYAIAIDTAGSGDIYTSGSFMGTVDFDPDTGVFNLTATVGYLNIFISKLDTSGNFVWAKVMEGATAYCNFIAIDPAGSGDIYTTGTFYGGVDFDPGPGVFNINMSGFGNIFISKLDSSGNFVWAKAMGDYEGDIGTSIAIDPAGSGAIYTTGTFWGTVDFDPGAGVFNLTSDGGMYSDIFISKLDGSGNFVWAKRMGGISYDGGESIAFDPAGGGALYITGSFYGTVDFDPDSSGSFNLTAAGPTDIFLSKLDASGNFVWAKAIGGTNNDGGKSIAIDASGNVYVTGSFDSPSITFGPTTLTNAGVGYDLFIAKLDTMTTLTGNNEIDNFGRDVLLFPNPLTNTTTIFFSLTQSQKVSLKIFDVNGRLVSNLAAQVFDAGENEIFWNAAEVNAGIYFLRLETASYSENRKLIVTK